ncbi:LOW QUALITY PROTEIN: uncharacterized protein, partial [Amphiura filiformis]|uniref:LOW QUALITY PROTEIN: uncharacterized protein n=1 Tax=Amphiura filiformis TaxID=82378 RepID=UPI003B20B629
NFYLQKREKLASIEARESNVNAPAASSEQSSTTTSQLIDASCIEGKYPINQGHISKSSPASYFCSPQHKGKLSNTVRMRSLSHQPSPLILSAAIARAKKQMEYTQEAADVEGFYDTDVPIPEMWLLRQPDGAPDNETDECVTTPHTNTPAHYATIDECKEIASFHGLSSMERPPAIGACASPAFEVEVNPCFSHEYDEVLKSVESLTHGQNIIVQHCTQMSEPCLNYPEKSGHYPNSALPKPRPLPKLPYQDGRGQHHPAHCSVSDSEYSRVPIMSCRYSKRTEKAPKLYASDSEYHHSRVPAMPGRMHRTDSYNGHTSSSSKNCASRLPYKSNSTNSINTQRCSGSMAKPSKKAPQTSKIPPYPSKTCPGKKSKCKLPASSHSDQSLMRNANNNIHLHPGHRLTNSSDGSNDSGIASTENVPSKHPNILSPYSTVTKPRLMRGSSSGHGSDNSSTISDCLQGNHAFRARMTGGASSGYESMLRDSEATASGSSAHDSLSEGSCGRVKGSKILKKKFPGSRRSRSAPPSRANSEPSSSAPQSSGRWKDLHPRPKRHENGVEIKVYEVDDMDKLPSQRPENVKRNEMTNPIEATSENDKSEVLESDIIRSCSADNIQAYREVVPVWPARKHVFREQVACTRPCLLSVSPTHPIKRISHICKYHNRRYTL